MWERSVKCKGLGREDGREEYVSYGHGLVFTDSLLFQLQHTPRKDTGWRGVEAADPVAMKHDVFMPSVPLADGRRRRRLTAKVNP